MADIHFILNTSGLLHIANLHLAINEGQITNDIIDEAREFNSELKNADYKDDFDKEATLLYVLTSIFGHSLYKVENKTLYNALFDNFVMPNFNDLIELNKKMQVFKNNFNNEEVANNILELSKHLNNSIFRYFIQRFLLNLLVRNNVLVQHKTMARQLINILSQYSEKIVLYADNLPIQNIVEDNND